MKKTYLIDSENINEVWVEILSALHDGDEILVFYTDKSAHMSYDKIIRLIEQEVGTVRWIKCFGGQNALDFQLVTELGYCLNQAADREYIIVSNDMGYDAAVRYWKLRGCKVSRIRGSECEKLVRKQQKEDAEAADGQATVEPEQPERIDMSGVPVRTVPMPSIAAEEPRPVPPVVAAEEPRPVPPVVTAEGTRPVSPAVAAEESGPVPPVVAVEESKPVKPKASEPKQPEPPAAAEEAAPPRPAARRRNSVRRRLSEVLDKPAAPVSPVVQEAEAAASAAPMEPNAAAEAPKPVAEAPKPVAEAPKSAAEAPKPAAEAPKPASETQKPAADTEVRSADAGRLQREAGRVREIVLEEEPYRIVLHTYEPEPWMPEPAAQPEQTIQEPVQIQESRQAVQEPVQVQESLQAEQELAQVQESRQADQEPAQSQPPSDDWAGRLKQVFHECGSRDPETDLAFLVSLCKTIRMSNMSVMHNVLEYQFGQKAGNGIYRFLKENPGCRSFLSAGYSNSKKQREREYLQLVLSRNEMNPADTDGILRIINALPRKNLNAIHVALVKRFGQEKGGAVYAVIRSHVKIIRGL